MYSRINIKNTCLPLSIRDPNWICNLSLQKQLWKHQYLGATCTAFSNSKENDRKTVFTKILLLLFHTGKWRNFVLKGIHCEVISQENLLALKYVFLSIIIYTFMIQKKITYFASTLGEGYSLQMLLLWSVW